MIPVKSLDAVECNRTVRNNLNSSLNFNDILSIMSTFGVYEKVKLKYGYGPAVYYKFIGGRGNIGFIPNHNSVCRYCNRLRLTPFGALKLCLFSQMELNIKDSFRRGLYDEEIMEDILNFVKIKPLDRNNNFTDINKELAVPGYMNKIGG